MSETISPTFTFVKDGVFYFSRRIPSELRRHYTSPRIAYSLRTRSPKVAEARARRAADQLDEYWYHLRSQEKDLPGKHMLRLQRTAGVDAAVHVPVAVSSSSAVLSEAVGIYLRQKGRGKSVTFHRAAERACGYVIEACGDKYLDAYTKADANAFRDSLITRGLAGTSMTRVFGTVRAVINFAASELGLSLNNPFTGVYYDRTAGASDRSPVPADALALVQSKCREIDDDLRWLVALVSDTGMRLVEEMGLDEADYAIFTGKEDMVNKPTSTPYGQARILFTTHHMLRSRCRGLTFEQAEVFHYQREVRQVRIWDEEMLPGEVVFIDTDQLAALRRPLRMSHPALAEAVEGLEQVLKASGGKGTYDWPNLEEATGVSLWSAKKGLADDQASVLESLYALSGRCVLLRRTSNVSKVITALDSRDAIPDDLAPAVILDASGRVRSTYSLWEKRKGNLVRLPSAVRNYRNLTVRVMDRGSGKRAWWTDGEVLALEVAKLIDSKPDEEWLVIYQKGGNGGTIPDQIMGLLGTDPGRVRFLNWGRHHGTNEFRHISNVILAGLNNYQEADYEMAARHYGGIPSDQDTPHTLVDDMQAGEHSHHILQALCRSALRQGSGLECGPCDAYIIAPKRSGVRDLLPQVFPGCTLGTWNPTKQKTKGKVEEALTYVRMYFEDYPDGVLLFAELRSVLGYDASNFRNRIRNHDSFKAGLEKLGIEEVIQGNGRHCNALAKVTQTFGPLEGAEYIADV